MLLNVVVGDQHAHEDVGMAPGVGMAPIIEMGRIFTT